MASNDGQKTPDLPRGLIGRKGTPTGRGARLPSIRGPRDLTLGGIPKKVFTPNIPARREKDKEQPKVEINQRKEKKEKHSDRKNEGKTDRGRGRGRGRGQAEVIQSHSIFEQGPTEKVGSRAGSSYSEYSGGSSKASTSSIRLKHENQNDGSKEVLDYLLRDDFIADGGTDDVKMKPVVLPLCTTETPKVENCDIKIKVEQIDQEMQDKTKFIKQESSSFTDSSIEETCQDLFTRGDNSEMGDLLFFQFPDTMPGIPSNQEDNDANSTATTVEKTSDELTQKISTCSLTDFSEGYMGKLIVRKSGRIQLLLGNITLDVTKGTKCGFLQDLVSIDTATGGSGSITVLGHVNERLVCTPDFDSLLNSL